MTNYANLPAPSPEAGLSRYLQEIRKFPMLEPEEEYMLARRWADEQDSEAAHKLVTSHLRLAAKIAMGYRGYGLPQAEVISDAPSSAAVLSRGRNSRRPRECTGT